MLDRETMCVRCGDMDTKFNWIYEMLYVHCNFCGHGRALPQLAEHAAELQRKYLLELERQRAGAAALELALL